MDTFSQWLDQLQQKGITEEQLRSVVTGAYNTVSTSLFLVMMTSLNEEDLQCIEAETDEQKADQLIRTFFQQRVGMTVDEVVQRLQTKFAEEPK